MARGRDVRTCDRCRLSKRRCNRARPRCSRCLQAGVRCSFDTRGSTETSPTALPPHHVVNQPLDPCLSAIFESPPSDTISTPSCPPFETGINNGNLHEIATTSAAPHDAPPARRRNRARLSCLRCYRLKVKCDKKLPCTRCAVGGCQAECSYNYKSITKSCRELPSSPSAPFVSAGEDGHSLFETWHSKHRGNSHWRHLLTQIDSFRPQAVHPYMTVLFEIDRRGPFSKPILSPYFPFVSPDGSEHLSHEAVLALIPEARLADIFIESYLGLVEKTYRVLHIPSFREEVDLYQAVPHTADMPWLAQFCMILGLGCLASADASTDAKEDRARQLFKAAEACLIRTPFMFRPSMASMRTLCLIIIAKQITITTCWEIDGLWPVIGLVVRLAISMGLNRDPQWQHKHCTPFEREMRCRLWTTIVYLDLQVSLSTGMPLLLQLEDFCPTAPNNVNDSDISPVDDGQIVERLFECTDASPQVLLYRSFPAVFSVLQHVNSLSHELHYDEALKYNRQIRDEMRHASRLGHGTLPLITLDIFFRRVLLVLHRNFAMHPQASSVFPISYWSSLECALALLVHQRTLCEESRGSQTGPAAVVGTFMMDFYTAALTVCLHLLRPDSLFEAAAMSASHNLPPRQTIMETLRYCVEIWATVANKSMCFQAAHLLLDAIMKSIPETSRA